MLIDVTTTDGTEVTINSNAIFKLHKRLNETHIEFTVTHVGYDNESDEPYSYLESMIVKESTDEIRDLISQWLPPAKES